MDDLRRVLDEKAQEFSMDPRPRASVVRRVRRNALLSMGRGAAVLALLAAASLAVLRDAPERRAPVAKAAPVTIDLVDEYIEGDDEHGGNGEAVSGDDVRRHVACMREHGFDLPDPTRTSDGWEIQVEDPEAMGFDTPEWREAAFVECSPEPPPGPGDLVLGVPMPDETIRTFEACMEREGFDLPDAIPSEPAGWKFELSGSEIDFGAEEWNRAVFITCWPEGLEP